MDVVDDILSEGFGVGFVEVVSIGQALISRPDKEMSAQGHVVLASPFHHGIHVGFEVGIESPFHSVGGGDFAAGPGKNVGIVLPVRFRD